MLLNWIILIVMTVLGLAAWYYYKKLTKKPEKQWAANIPASYIEAAKLAALIGAKKHCSKKVLAVFLQAEKLEPKALEFALENADVDYEQNAEFQARAFLEMFQHIDKADKQRQTREHLLEKCGFTEAETKHAMAFTVDLESEFIDPYHVK